MPEAAGVLVDTSIWIDFFHVGHSPQALHLDELLQTRAILTCDPIRTEVCSGARTAHERSRLHELFRAVSSLTPPPDLWARIEEARFTLARRGHQTSLIDLMIAATAAHHHVPLWTLDRDFEAIRHAIEFQKYR